MHHKGRGEWLQWEWFGQQSLRYLWCGFYNCWLLIYRNNLYLSPTHCPTFIPIWSHWEQTGEFFGNNFMSWRESTDKQKHFKEAATGAEAYWSTMVFLLKYLCHPGFYGFIFKFRFRTSLVVQWLRILLPIQGTYVRSLVWDDSTYCGTTKLVSCNYWSLCAREPVFRNKGSYHNGKPMYRNQSVAPACQNQRKPAHSNADSAQPKINE